MGVVLATGYRHESKPFVNRRRGEIIFMREGRASGKKMGRPFLSGHL